MKLHRDGGVSQKTAWFMLMRIREAWVTETAAPFPDPPMADHFRQMRTSLESIGSWLLRCERISCERWDSLTSKSLGWQDATLG